MLLVAGSLAKDGNTTISWFSAERNALLKFKASFYDPSHRLLSWNSRSTDCSKWQGVKCDKLTGHVIVVDLRNEYFDPANMLFSETLDSSIVKLKHLSFLDLSGNDFKRGSIPAFIGFMNQLQYLNLSYANFSGVIPHQMGNLSRLRVLDLGSSRLGIRSLDSNSSIIIDDFTWVSRLSSLTHLDMGSINLASTKDHLFKVLHMLPSIIFLSLQLCGLENRHLQHECVINSTTLLPNIRHLDLSGNLFGGELPCFLENMMSIRYLDLSSNSFQCTAYKISEVIQNNCNLESLYLESNSCSGDISNLIRLNSSKCLDPKLAIVDLRNNHFYGQLPEEIGGFSKLEFLDLDGSLISGRLPASISNLSALTTLSLSRNELNGSIPSYFGNLTSLSYLDLRGNQLSGEFPTFLGQLQNLETLSISGNYFHGTISESHLVNLSKLQSLDIGNDQTKLGVRSDWMPPFQLRYLFIESCEIEGGQFPKWLLHPSLTSFILSDNRVEGPIPESLCGIYFLQFLDLSKNSLSGDLPECLFNLTKLFGLNLSSNRFSGVIPNSIGGAYSLSWLKLSDNTISGEIPSSIRNCKYLIFLDVGHNNLTGRVPKWIGKYLHSLVGLRLTHNKFYDTIPFELCYLSALKILDLANNKLTGNIPRCFGNFSKMVTGEHEHWIYPWYHMQAVMKGTEREYHQNMIYVITIDLSKNNLVGEIPLELTRLVALTSLNLSHNHLRGMIPGTIGEIKSLESLDLSNNNLFGNIPESLSNLDFLGFLNLSHNNFSGKIPTRGHLQTLDDPWRYEGNPGLCGASLLHKCNGDKATGTPSAEFSQTDEEEHKADRIWFYGVVIGSFAMGFWGAIGVLMFKQGWRYAYFKFADDIICRVFGR